MCIISECVLNCSAGVLLLSFLQSKFSRMDVVFCGMFYLLFIYVQVGTVDVIFIPGQVWDLSFCCNFLSVELFRSVGFDTWSELLVAGVCCLLEAVFVDLVWSWFRTGMGYCSGLFQWCCSFSCEGLVALISQSCIINFFVMYAVRRSLNSGYKLFFYGSVLEGIFLFFNYYSGRSQDHKLNNFFWGLAFTVAVLICLSSSSPSRCFCFLPWIWWSAWRVCPVNWGCRIFSPWYCWRYSNVVHGFGGFYFAELRRCCLKGHWKMLQFLLGHWYCFLVWSFFLDAAWPDWWLSIVGFVVCGCGGAWSPLVVYFPFLI